MRAVKLISILYFFLGLFGLSACSTGGGSSAAPAGQLSPTIYYRPVINLQKENCSSNDLHDLKDKQGGTLVTMCEASYKKCFIQGSCLVINHGKQRSIGYGGKRKGVVTFEEIASGDCPYGRGVQDICLDPYFTVAADLSIYKAGDVIYVPKLVGLKLPDGETHDGYLIIRDEGGGVKGATRFDFFTGYLNYNDKRNVMAKLGLGDPANSIDFQLASPVMAQKIRQNRLYPGLPHLENLSQDENFESSQISVSL